MSDRSEPGTAISAIAARPSAICRIHPAIWRFCRPMLVPARRSTEPRPDAMRFVFIDTEKRHRTGSGAAALIGPGSCVVAPIALTPV